MDLFCDPQCLLWPSPYFSVGGHYMNFTKEYQKKEGKKSMNVGDPKKFQLSTMEPSKYLIKVCTQ